MRNPQTLPKPPWLKIQLPKGENWQRIAGLTQQLELGTVCQEANCPNLGECWNSGTATFLLLGQICTRACRFCSVQTQGSPPPVDLKEAEKLVASLHSLQLKYLVLTSVDRDDLPDQGAGQIASSVSAAHEYDPHLKIELLMPDFQGERNLIERMADLPLSVLGHNLESVESKSQEVRDPRCGYDQSLEVLRIIKDHRPDRATKSSLMVGFGETKEEVVRAMRDLSQVGVDFLTIGQYLQPHKNKIKVQRYWTPGEFEELKLEALNLGFKFVASGPLVRSSYKAFELWMERSDAQLSTTP